MLKEVNLVIPDSLEDALRVLADKREKAQPVAGATNIILELQNGSEKELLIGLDNLHELTGISEENGYLILGSATRMTEVLKSDLIARYGVPLHEAAALFATPMIRNRATPGGNLVDASPAADTAPPLLAMGAEVELCSVNGKRWIPLDEFFLGVNKTICQPDELLLSIRWKKPSEKTAGGFTKIGLRKGMVCSILSAAAQVELDSDHRVNHSRIALGAVAARPIRALIAEKFLSGKSLNSDVIAEAGELASQSSSPIDDIRGSADYRRKMSAVLVRRVLDRIAVKLAG